MPPAKLAPGVVALRILAALGLLAAAHFAEAVLLPVAVALVLTFLFSPLVRALRSRGVNDAVGAAVVVGGLVIGGVVLGSSLAAPAAAWWDKAPHGVQQLLDRAEAWRRSVPFLAPARPATRAAQPPADPVKEKIASESVALTGAVLMRVGSAALFGAATLILTFFLLASERWLITRTVQAIESRRRRVSLLGAVRAAQRDIAGFLATQALINSGVALATGLACWVIGLPNPVLWGAFAGLMSFIPYLGPLVVLGTLFFAGALTFDTLTAALLAPAAFAVVNLIESNFVTPWVVGRRLELSPLAVFLAVMLAGWLWGIPGAFIAVPALVAFRAVARRSKGLRPWAIYLDRARAEPRSLRSLLQLARRRGTPAGADAGLRAPALTVSSGRDAPV
jgi:predicted PurR-regulated permease PerM